MLRKTIAASFMIALTASGFALTSSTAEAGQSKALAINYYKDTVRVDGRVVDGFGKPIDDVKVQAVTLKNKPVASALTYASDRFKKPTHGYYFLEVLPGKYKVTYSMKGYKTVVDKFSTISEMLGKTRLLEKTKTSVVPLGKKNNVSKLLVTVKGSKSKPSGVAQVFLKAKNSKLITKTIKVKNGKSVLPVANLPEGVYKAKVVFSAKQYAKSSSKPILLLKK